VTVVIAQRLAEPEIPNQHTLSKQAFSMKGKKPAR
jgi:hypothetical protein